MIFVLTDIDIAETDKTMFLGIIRQSVNRTLHVAVIARADDILVFLNTHGFMCINVQETDLAGHSQNPYQYALILKMVDFYLGKIIKILVPGDVLIVTADHGNDPTIGHSQHTREYVPLLISAQGLKPQNIGVRETMADTAATVAHFFKSGLPEAGKSYLDCIFRCKSKVFQLKC